MKRFLTVALAPVLALALLGSSAAVAAPYGHGFHGGSYGRHYGGGNGALVAGVGLFALAAILATSHDHYQPAPYYDDYRSAPPPPRYDDSYGYDGR